MKISHYALLFSILLLGACSAEESIAAAEPEEIIPDYTDPFEVELAGIMSVLRSADMMSRYSYKKNTAEGDYTEETREYLFFDIRKTIFNSASLTKINGTKAGSSKNFDNEFVKRHRTEGELKEIKNPKILTKDTTTGNYIIVNKPNDYTLYGWNFTHINRWYHDFKFWDDELPMLIGGKVPFFIKANEDQVIMKNVKYVIHSPELNKLPEILYIIHEPFGDPKEISYEKDFL